jgi:hypothetical protein
VLTPGVSLGHVWTARQQPDLSRWSAKDDGAVAFPASVKHGDQFRLWLRLGRLSRPRRLYFVVFLAGFAAGAAAFLGVFAAAFFAGAFFAAGGTASASAVRSTTESSPPKLLGR